MKSRNAQSYLEYVLVSTILRALAILPRPIRLKIAYFFGYLGYLLAKRLRLTARKNLEMALPNLSSQEHEKIIKGVFRNFGRLLAEFSYFPKFTCSEIEKIVVYEGLEHYLNAINKGRGVLFLTGHVGAWELSSFAHASYGYPHNILVRQIDNPYIDRLVDYYRSCKGNKAIDKNNSVKAILSALKRGEAVGILIDLNTVRNQGVFCDFFGIPACSTTGLATLALRTRAAVVPGFLLWDEALGKHKLHFEPEVELIITGDQKEDIYQNTAQFNKVVEKIVKLYPDQWMWVHRRWKTRPEGESGFY
ncbi:MAG: lysophospholipid acyltransferase family protein [Acidobacteria bacterium]|nr:lysophospholipid acyltransferase family protein [Acidobacteriota bacterium]